MAMLESQIKDIKDDLDQIQFEKKENANLLEECTTLIDSMRNDNGQYTVSRKILETVDLLCVVEKILYKLYFGFEVNYDEEEWLIFYMTNDVTKIFKESLEELKQLKQTFITEEGK